MREMYFYVDSDGDVGEFMNSLGVSQTTVLEDLVVIANFGPESLQCERLADGMWQYERAIGSGRRVILLFDYLPSSATYLVLHGVRAGASGISRADLRTARARRRANMA